MPIVLVTADTCGHCTAFKKNNLPSLQEELDKAEIELIHINVPDMGMVVRSVPNVKLSGPEALGKHYKVPPEFFSMVVYFPTMAAIKKIDGKYKVFAVGGEIQNGKITPKTFVSGPALIKWYKNLKKDKSGYVLETKSGAQKVDKTVSTPEPETRAPIAIPPVANSAPPAPQVQSQKPSTVPAPEHVERRVLSNGSVMSVPRVYMTYQSPMVAMVTLN